MFRNLILELTENFLFRKTLCDFLEKSIPGVPFPKVTSLKILSADLQLPTEEGAERS